MPRPQPAAEQEVCYLHGALRYPQGEWYGRALPAMNACRVIEFCEGLLEDFPDQEVWLILDGAPAHRSLALGEFLEAQPRLHLQFQPTYAPWTNPVERLWQEMRKRATHCHVFPTLVEVVAAALRWGEALAADPAAACQLAAFQRALPS